MKITAKRTVSFFMRDKAKETDKSVSLSYYMAL